MDLRLLDYAKDAQDTATALSTFLDEIPEYSKEIKGDIAELFAISSALDVLHEDLALSRYGRHVGRIVHDLDICLPSLEYTLEDIRNIFNKSKRKGRQHPGAFPGTPPYAQIWEDACDEMRAQGIPLSARLEMYRTYLQGLHDILRSKGDDGEVDHIRARLSKILKKQEPIDDYFSRLSSPYRPLSPYPTAPRTPQPYQYHAPPLPPRPHVERGTTYPAYHPHQHPPPPPPPPPPPRSPVYGEIPYIPPIVPEVPQSPTYSNASSNTYSLHSNDSGGPVAHWAMKILDGRHSSTPFQTLGQPTRCLGRDEPQAIELLVKDGFEKVLELPFEATNVWVRLYWRSEDNRARILFLTLDPTGRRMRYCFPLTGLKVLRTESSLQLCRVNREDGQLDLWANLRFTLYERITMVAMKRQDDTQTPPGLEDFFQPGEQQEFGGEIQDDTYAYRHALRIFRDKDSGCVRFEATPRRGPLKTIPIWTAFVTQYVGHRGWMKRVGAQTVSFRELHPYMFTDGYKLPKGSSGRYQLTFTTPNDARSFMETFHQIRVR
ncbi:uncharacterized protein CC84DRAFT_1086894 [Paraphaeosphaeria sporulosa]|uniref:Uncharacterized protein n=1 Tax=Paraphaeosphaeria sporulosa TaxID=1460663 RepID=A0A177CNK4_9PLEO|nr:uncharacterized protein CC84DRAFT_1086894 [Paraphaeosphaeria sporulosa]OAG08337.1 hypothetical protein CC84DRAFT_1086894 [Paraphaeosphaeria sporulosa]